VCKCASGEAGILQSEQSVRTSEQGVVQVEQVYKCAECREVLSGSSSRDVQKWTEVRTSEQVIEVRTRSLQSNAEINTESE
jgi:hypothetical protein